MEYTKCPDQRERREAGNVYSTSAEIGTCHVYMSMCEYMSMMTPNDATSDTPRPVRRHLATGRRGALLRLGSFASFNLAHTDH